MFSWLSIFLNNFHQLGWSLYNLLFISSWTSLYSTLRTVLSMVNSHSTSTGCCAVFPVKLCVLKYFLKDWLMGCAALHCFPHIIVTSTKCYSNFLHCFSCCSFKWCNCFTLWCVSLEKKNSNWWKFFNLLQMLQFLWFLALPCRKNWVRRVKDTQNCAQHYCWNSTY